MRDWLVPDWPAPDNVVAVSTTRTGGVSVGARASMNLGAHVDDDAEAVAENRRRLRSAVGLEREPAWLRQVHGTRVVEVAGAADSPPEADGSWSRTAGTACAVLTADCLPVLLTNREGSVVAAAHAGWRGLEAGVIERTVEAMTSTPGSLIAWLGPAISQPAFEVGEEVREAFVRYDPEAASAFAPNARGRWQADLYALARQRLAGAGVEAVHGGGLCTFGDAERFFSYRRDPGCGRMATLIAIRPESTRNNRA